MSVDHCPRINHYHVVFEQVGSFKRPHKKVVAPDEKEAMILFLQTLPVNWRGGVSVFDDTNVHEDEMPRVHTSL